MVLVAWFTFMIGAAIFAATKRRDVVPAGSGGRRGRPRGELRPARVPQRVRRVPRRLGDDDVRRRRGRPPGRDPRPGRRDAPRQHPVRRRQPRRAGGLERRDEPERDRRRGRHAARRSSASPDAPTLRVEGTNWFGGWGITSTRATRTRSCRSRSPSDPPARAAGHARRSDTPAGVDPRRATRRHGRSAVGTVGPPTGRPARRNDPDDTRSTPARRRSTRPACGATGPDTWPRRSTGCRTSSSTSPSATRPASSTRRRCSSTGSPGPAPRRSSPASSRATRARSSPGTGSTRSGATTAATSSRTASCCGTRRTSSS